MKRLAVMLCLLFAISPALAVQPDEILKDSTLESRARALSAEFRCMVCQNQSIDDSEAALARDLRLLIREHLVKGETDTQIKDYIVARYGDFVLLKPRFTAKTLALWLTPFVVLIGAIMALLWRRKGMGVAAENPLTEAEKVELKNVIDRTI